MYHFRHAMKHDQISERLERIAHRVVLIGLFTVGAGAVVMGVTRLVTGAEGGSSNGGTALAAVSLVMLVILSMRKQRLARVVGSDALLADGRLSGVGAMQAAVTLFGTAAARLLPLGLGRCGRGNARGSGCDRRRDRDRASAVCAGVDRRGLAHQVAGVSYALDGQIDRQEPAAQAGDVHAEALLARAIRPDLAPEVALLDDRTEALDEGLRQALLDRRQEPRSTAVGQLTECRRSSAAADDARPGGRGS